MMMFMIGHWGNLRVEKDFARHVMLGDDEKRAADG
jgi:hypothetical protein